MNIDKLNVKLLDDNNCININGGDKFLKDLGRFLGSIDKWSIDHGYIKVW